MSDTYERKTEKHFCYFTKHYVHVTLVTRRWRTEDGVSLAEEDRAIECPHLLKCRRAGYNCVCVNRHVGQDPFTPPSNLLADMW